MIVETSLGAIQGVVSDGLARYRAVPYAEPVNGEWRFRSPRPLGAWEGVLDANRPSKCSVQYPATIFDTALGEYFAGGDVDDIDVEQVIDENCLELSVLAPAEVGSPKPVMVYIHGGGFFAGSHALATASDSFVRENDVVLVGVNHRLGLLGFLAVAALDDAFAASANVGLQDLVEALRWIQDHIAAFGGDPSTVTIFGESGGAMKVASLMAMPSAQGLFHRAIMESGAAPSFAAPPAAAATARQVLEQLGVVEGPGAVTALQEVPADALFAVSLTMPNAFGPYVDGDILPASPFATDWEPASMVPVIVGSCLDEFTWFANDALTDENSAAILRETLGDRAKPIIEEYRTEFQSDRAVALRALSDSVFGTFVERVKTVLAPSAPVYTYLFAWQTPVADGKYGAFHTAELPLVLRHVRYSESEELSCRLATLWSSFARTGQPNHPEIHWPAATPNDSSTLILELERAAPGPSRTRQSFWAHQAPLAFDVATTVLSGRSNDQRQLQQGP
jgi:para-nitrobenzyl esterase